MTAAMLVFPDLNKPFIIYSDANYCCTQAVISQKHEIEGKSKKGL